jgi:hypothetical protein
MLKTIAECGLVVLAALAVTVFTTGKPVVSVMLTKIVLLVGAAGVLVWHWRRVRVGMGSSNWLKTKGLVLVGLG